MSKVISHSSRHQRHQHSSEKGQVIAGVHPVPNGREEEGLDDGTQGGALITHPFEPKSCLNIPIIEKHLQHQVTLPGQEEPWDIRSLLVWIKKNLLKERPELFIQGDSVRPGILVLVNDADWELLGELDYQLQDQDSVLFISTLHGG